MDECYYIFIEDIKDFFNSSTFNHYLIKLERKSQLYESDDYLNRYSDNFKNISSFFNSFKTIWDEGKIGKLKGTFLELFTFKYLEFKYPASKIYRESRMFYGNFISSMLIDVVAELENNEFKIFECKFSKHGFERKYLDNLYAISKVCPVCDVFVLTMEKYDDFYNFIYNLKKDTSSEKFSKIVNSIDILSLECFEEGYFLISN